MTKIAYLECPTGIAGDMCLGALIHAGLPLEYLETQLQRLGVSHEYTLRVETVQRNGQSATKLQVDLNALADPEALIHREPGVDVHPTFRRVDSQSPSGDLTHQSIHLNIVNPNSEKHSGSHSHLCSHPHSHLHSHRGHSHPQGAGSSQDSASHFHPPLHGHQVSSAESLESPMGTLNEPAASSHASASHHHAGTRHLADIEQMILAAGLPPRAEAWSLAVFRQLAIAEGAVHGIPIEAVHFHEVGATDAIVDIVGTCLGLDWLGIEQLYCSAMPIGGGTIWAAHGRLPVPSPAVLKLWEMRQVPIYSNGIERELVTPTGAAIATTLAAQFGPPPPMTLTRVGLGAGGRDLPIPNILRLWIGESSSTETGRLEFRQTQALPTLPTVDPSQSVKPLSPATPANANTQVTVLETQIDDANPQAIAYTLETLLAAGALDVFTQPVTMKKSRLGTLITVICPIHLTETCKAVLFRETTTLGIRESVQQRTLLDREFQTVETEFGAIAIKLGKHPVTGMLLNVQPEYEDCAKLARDRQVSWSEVHQAALRAWESLHQKSYPQAEEVC
ncbi:nickel pincer cofactor biosynthesis protein LarC [Thermoleptolyngbya sp.]